MSLFLDLLQQLSGFGDAQSSADAGASITSGGLFGPVVSFFATITDGKMWRSLGWIILGVIVMAFGINLWLHNPLGRAAGRAAETAAVA